MMSGSVLRRQRNQEQHAANPAVAGSRCAVAVGIRRCRSEVERWGAFIRKRDADLEGAHGSRAEMAGDAESGGRWSRCCRPGDTSKRDVCRCLERASSLLFLR
ncbi:putative alpha-2A adrenergic receptor [Sesbania bispinosa]|nr:putative alpha-2A adrenergic receptor [Sesbania bispinosa]